MTIDVVIPKLGFAMVEGQLAEWLVNDGGAVTEGQPLYSLESEKAVEEVPAPATGTLRILVTGGALLPVGTVIGYII